MVKKKKAKTNTTNTTTSNVSTLKNTTWNFDYVYLNEKVKKLKGTIALELLNRNSLKLNSDATFTVKFTTNTFSFDLTTSSFKELDENTNGD